MSLSDNRLSTVAFLLFLTGQITRIQPLPLVVQVNAPIVARPSEFDLANVLRHRFGAAEDFSLLVDDKEGQSDISHYVIPGQIIDSSVFPQIPVSLLNHQNVKIQLPMMPGVPPRETLTQSQSKDLEYLKNDVKQSSLSNEKGKQPEKLSAGQLEFATPHSLEPKLADKLLGLLGSTQSDSSTGHKDITRPVRPEPNKVGKAKFTTRIETQTPKAEKQIQQLHEEKHSKIKLSF